MGEVNVNKNTCNTSAASHVPVDKGEKILEKRTYPVALSSFRQYERMRQQHQIHAHNYLELGREEELCRMLDVSPNILAGLLILPDAFATERFELELMLGSDVRQFPCFDEGTPLKDFENKITRNITSLKEHPKLTWPITRADVLLSMHDSFVAINSSLECVVKVLEKKDYCRDIRAVVLLTQCKKISCIMQRMIKRIQADTLRPQDLEGIHSTSELLESVSILVVSFYEFPLSSDEKKERVTVLKLMVALGALTTCMGKEWEKVRDDQVQVESVDDTSENKEYVMESYYT